jgi:hypothetical protein
MAQIPGSIRVTGYIAPTDTTDIFATHDSLYGRGGLREVADLTERDAITADRRREGMVVYVIAEGTNYQLVGGTDNANWAEFKASLSSKYVSTVNGITGDVVLVPGNGIGIDSSLNISVTGDYALNTLLAETSASLYAIDVETSGTLTTMIGDATQLIVDTSGALYAIDVDTSAALTTLISDTNQLLVETSGNLYAIDVATSGALTTLIDTTNQTLAETSAALYSIDVATSGNLYQTIVDVSAAIDGNFVHRTGNVQEIVTGEKDFADNTLFAQSVTICGDLFIAGATTTVGSSAVTVADRIITVNAGEPGVGVTNLYAGMEVDRGTGAPYYMVFDELRDAFVVGTPGGPVTDAGTLMELQVVATREDNPIESAVPYWQDAGSPSGGRTFVTSNSFKYNSITGLDVNSIVYNPAVAGNWSVAPTEVFGALDTLAADLGSTTDDLTQLIVDTSGALYAIDVATSGALYQTIVDTSGALTTLIETNYQTLVDTSAALYAIDVATSGTLQSEIDALDATLVGVSGELYQTVVDTSAALYAIDVATSGALYQTVVDTSGALQTNIDNNYQTLVGVSGELYQTVVDTSAALYAIDVATSGALTTLIETNYQTLVDTSAALYAIDVSTSGTLYQIIVDTSGALQANIDTTNLTMVGVSGDLYTLVGDTSAFLQSEIDALGTSLTGSYVTLNSAQEITGAKTFLAPVTITLSDIGLAPFVVNATGSVLNLNSDMVDGYHLADITASSADYTNVLIAALSGSIDGVTSRVSTLEISAVNHEVRIDNLETSVDTISNSLSTIMQGNVACDTVNYKYTVSHPAINVNNSFPVVSLTVPTSSSVLYVQGITNRTSTGFDIVLSDVPDVGGYSLNWTMPLSGSAVVVRAYGVHSTTQAGGSYTADAGAYDTFELVYTGSVTVNPPSSMADGQTVNIITNSIGSGSSLVWNGFKFAGGSSPTATVNGTDIYTILKKGSNYFVSYTQALG